MKFDFKLATVAAGFLGYVFAQSAERKIAIIGAGAAGSAAAYFLNQLATEAGVNVNVTLFEKTNHIGGRSITINAFDDPAQPFEQGASIFVPINYVLYESMNAFGLTPRDPDVGSDPVMGIWDGNSFVFTINENHPEWWTNLKILLRYGPTAPQKAKDLVTATIGRFLQMYTPQFFPFESLTERAEQLNLTAVTGVTGQHFLAANGVGTLYANELIQSLARVNYASNLPNMHGLCAMGSVAAQGAIAVQGGNWQIFDEMAQRSDAHIQLDTAVTAIDKDSSGTKFEIQTTSGSTPGTPSTYPTSFDNVIIANPFQFSGISVGEDVFSTTLETIDYVQLHVTIFTSTKKFKPSFFNLPSWISAPGAVLTTLAKTDTPTSGPDGVGKPGFWSLTTLGKATNPQTNQQENVYKIFSPEAVTPSFLSDLLGGTVPSTFTGGSSPISWYKATVFHSYPKTSPRTTFQDPIVGEGVYYTSGIEAFLSTMETSALMGKNVARLIVDDILAAGSGSGSKMVKSRESDSERDSQGVWWEKQSVLN
ncbi:hypothetical protein VTJ49DRAFT_7282 [Mycothermus thermophilus]|uniref:Prenylcysteine lyase domain-containing protein n=1 Tax=Humicola insolens TaxID=85995 RepID=A0ABR3VH95_HUMIN